MNRAFLFPFVILFFAIDAIAQKNDKHDFRLDVKIPSTWIEKVRRYNYKQNNASILKELEAIIKPRVIYIPAHEENLDKNKPGLLNPIFTDLDGEPGEEMICTLGWDENYPSMAVFKKKADSWHLIYMEDYYMFYSQPDMYIVNNFSKNKTFYFRRVHERGSGIYMLMVIVFLS
ncbi:hypothetical protein [Mucilaginibacter auburnensis]|uniref:Uncharacterized protein n=1 Tax=Mucilaginibacter auburnensis TaxID=1457233 RepID=A0A2H9VPX5_9SPHI|nr:hypothetical protein [Mucilaginibacter auburnensis]PJJ80399.1 hypothetical protein CLV57_3549 [Mucilaginibacter auburnensis]